MTYLVITCQPADLSRDRTIYHPSLPYQDMSHSIARVAIGIAYDSCATYVSMVLWVSYIVGFKMVNHLIQHF